MGRNVIVVLIRFHCYNSLRLLCFQLLASFHSNFGTKFFEGGVYVIPHLNLILQILLMFTLFENIEKYWSNIKFMISIIQIHNLPSQIES